MKIDKSTGVPAILAAAVSFCALLAIMWGLVRPVISEAVAGELADDIKAAVQNEMSPIKGGFDVLLTQQIIQTQKAIALLERKGITNLTPEETTQLVDLRAQLEAQQMALRELRR